MPVPVAEETFQQFSTLHNKLQFIVESKGDVKRVVSALASTSQQLVALGLKLELLGFDEGRLHRPVVEAQNTLNELYYTLQSRQQRPSSIAHSYGHASWQNSKNVEQHWHMSRDGRILQQSSYDPEKLKPAKHRPKSTPSGPVPTPTILNDSMGTRPSRLNTQSAPATRHPFVYPFLRPEQTAQDDSKLPDLPRPTNSAAKPGQENIKANLTEHQRFTNRRGNVYVVPPPPVGAHPASNVLDPQPGPGIGVGDWKRDPMLRSWYHGVTSRKSVARTKAIRTANKDANWVLQRREVQMKAIRERQRAELIQADIARQQATQPKRSRQVMGAKPQTDDGVMVHDDVLEWQEFEPGDTPPHVGDKTKDMAIWVRPGLFVSKAVGVPHSKSNSKVAWNL
ncbi:hypothetical protein CYMTET_20451 [Cymbomonas tetramitiformis]|uniref:Uncharacterized protein n=1 Tax=Cymbomonas tetramitiformis TaxID=36881 RepID=A0AAE0G4P8_9CHLO|nr:hypothetical protein CYMTET_20451 [Cymbomonas tetramitiformis]